MNTAAKERKNEHNHETDKEQIRSLRRVLRDVHSRLTLMEQMMNRGLMDGGQLRVGVAKAARLVSEYFAEEEAKHEHRSEGTKE